jgi:hypothetical protein
MVAVPDVVPLVAVTVAVAPFDTGVVVTGNVALVCPCAICTDGFTVAAELLLESCTEAPPAGAGVARFTVPVALWPPVTVFGLMVTLATPGAGLAGAVIVSGAVTVLRLVAETEPLTVEETGCVCT